MILDENELGKDQKHLRVRVFRVSPDHKLLAYSTDTDGSMKFTLQVKSLETGELLSDKIENCSFSFAWANDSQTFFYSQLDESGGNRLYKARKHILGTGIYQDQTVYEERDRRFKDLAERCAFVIGINQKIEQARNAERLPLAKPTGGSQEPVSGKSLHNEEYNRRRSRAYNISRGIREPGMRRKPTHRCGV